MFTFLNTSILAGIAAISIPLIILLITRQKVKRIDFSSILFLRELRSQRIRRIKIRQLLLLIIRTLIVLLLILAFARPTLKGSFSSSLSAAAKTSVVILLDNSLSMGREVNGESLIDQAKRKIAEISELFKNGDEIYALYTNESVTPVYQGARYDVESVMKNIRRVEATHSRSDIPAAIIEAKKLLSKANNINREIYLVSDLQKSGFKEMKDLSAPLLENTDIKLFVMPCKANESSNLSVISTKSANQIIEKGKLFELDAVVKNFGSYDEKNKLIQLYVQGKRTAQSTVHLKSGESRKITFNIIPQNSGILSGYVIAEDDDLLADNKRLFTFHVPDKIKALIVGKTAEDCKYLKLAVDISSNIAAKSIGMNKIGTIDFASYDVVLMVNVPQISTSLSNKISNYLDQDGALILFLGSDVDLKSYNSNLCKKLSIPGYTESVGVLGNKDKHMTFDKIDYYHPIINGMFLQKPEEIDSPRFYYFINSKVDIGTEVIAAYSNGNPFLSENRLKQGKILRFNTGTDNEWTDFHFSGIFVPMINRSIAYIAGVNNKALSDLLVDDAITASVLTQGQSIDFRMEKPDDTFDKLKTIVEGVTYKIRFQATGSPGIYTLRSNEEIIEKWAINNSPQESEKEIITESELTDIAGSEHIRYISQDQPSRESIMMDRYGKELWKYFIVIALILLLAEMMIAREPEKAAV